MTNANFDINSLITSLAQQIVGQIRAELTQGQALKPRLLTVEHAATYMGRTEEAMQHMVASGKVPTVRIDRRVFIDVRDLEQLIETNKTSGLR